MSDFRESNVDSSVSERYLSERKESKNDIKRIKAEKGLSSIAKTMLSIAFLGVVAIGVLFAWHKWNPIDPPEPIPVDVTVLEEQLVDIQEISTAKYTYTDMQTFKDPKRFPIIKAKIPLTTKSFTLRCSGEIKAFYDMSKCDINVTDTRVTVTLPEIQISNMMDNKVVEEHDNVFNRISLDDQTEQVEALKIIMLDRAIKKGLMDEARDGAEKTIAGIVSPVLREGQSLEIKQSLAARSNDEKYVENVAQKASKVKKDFKAVDDKELIDE